MMSCLIRLGQMNSNPWFQVRPKPSSQKCCLDVIENMLKNEFCNMSGIIYTTSIKDCEDLRQELRLLSSDLIECFSYIVSIEISKKYYRNRGCEVSGYHAQLQPSLRSKVHKKWLSGQYQAVVATIAFGLGIDKPDVRFVIHYSLSKSMENFYQVSAQVGCESRCYGEWKHKTFRRRAAELGETGNQHRVSCCTGSRTCLN